MASNHDGEDTIDPQQRKDSLGDIIGEPDLDHPNAARMYDYYLGGSANFPIDRESAERQIKLLPSITLAVRENRAFLQRVVRYCAQRGIDQFLDLGSGIPTEGNVHEIAQEVNPDARVAYVDIEPVAVAHSRRLLAHAPHVRVSQADLRKPVSVLAAPDVAQLLDPSRPIGLLAVSVLHFVPDAEDPVGIMATFRDFCAPGSVVAVSHTSGEALTTSQVREGLQLYDQTPTPVTLRPRERAGELLAGWNWVEPGVVDVCDWRPDAPVAQETRDAVSGGWAVVGELTDSGT